MNLIYLRSSLVQVPEQATQADLLREGIAWIAYYRVGRSWGCRTFWLDAVTDTFEPEDLDEAKSILAQDANAVLLNSYYCGRLGGSTEWWPNLQQLEAGIRWHYENGYNRLAGWLAEEHAA